MNGIIKMSLFWMIVFWGAFNFAGSAKGEVGGDAPSSEAPLMYQRTYPVSSDFHNKLAAFVKEDPRKHKGVASMFKLVGVKFPEGSVIALTGGVPVIAFFGPKEEHLKIRRIINKVEGRIDLRWP